MVRATGTGYGDAYAMGPDTINCMKFMFDNKSRQQQRSDLCRVLTFEKIVKFLTNHYLKTHGRKLFFTNIFPFRSGSEQNSISDRK